MSQPRESIDEILRRTANDHTIPVQTAQVLLLIGAQLLDQAKRIEELEARVERQAEVMVRLGKQIDRIKGIHGA